VLFLFIDMGMLWLLLNVVTDENWDDRKLTVFSMVAIIGFGGGFLTRATAEYIGLLSLGVYFGVGLAVLLAMGSLALRPASIVMGVFLGYKVIVSVLLLSMLSG